MFCIIERNLWRIQEVFFHYLNAWIRLDDPTQILLQHGLIKRCQMTWHNLVFFQFFTVFLHSLKRSFKDIEIMAENQGFLWCKNLTDWKSASDLFLLACATNFIASISEPLYLSASLPLTILWTSSGLKNQAFGSHYSTIFQWLS